METENTSDVCAAVVKGQALFRKNAAQHLSDLTMLQQTNPSFKESLAKDIECIRVDGASDEGPGHEEVQFYWTERHLSMSKACTIVTTRHSGGSYLNKVELLNGCISKIIFNMWQNTEQETVSSLHQVKLSSPRSVKEQGRAS
ncbi:unnamed protein product [Porites lobata]|uniref:Uncharacterized protein n=1 Tax=Porites lobata TaxID=104759 RepID=A0ABN8Q6J5_9CNID|nr:unnamed protein product [Porites lobata]